MRAIRMTETGGPQVLTPADLPDPSPGPGEVLVEVAAAGVNYIDTYQRDGIYPVALPHVLGLEGVGRVRERGEGVSGFAVGDRVAWCEVPGSYAELVVAPVGRLVRVPDAVADETAVGALLQGMTAHFLVTDCHAVRAGEDVLVHAAAGGVGLLLVQLAAARGARVIATTSSPEKAELARAAGAADVLGYADVPGAVRELTGGAGAAAVYDSVGATTFDASLDAVRRRGVLVLYGAASGPVPPVDPQRLNRAGSVYLTRPKLYDYVATPGELAQRAAAVYGAVTAGDLDVRIGHRFPLEEARAAHEDLQGRRTTGKILLLPAQAG